VSKLLHSNNQTKTQAQATAITSRDAASLQWLLLLITCLAAGIRTSSN
jgi:hypothetical protein